MTVIVNDSHSSVESKKDIVRPLMPEQNRKVLEEKKDSFGTVVKKDLAIA